MARSRSTTPKDAGSTPRADPGGRLVAATFRSAPQSLARAGGGLTRLPRPPAQFRRKEQRVEAHIFLCVLAYHLLISIEKTLLDQGLHTSWATVRETLSTHHINTVVLPTNGGLVLKCGSQAKSRPGHFAAARQEAQRSAACAETRMNRRSAGPRQSAASRTEAHRWRAATDTRTDTSGQAPNGGRPLLQAAPHSRRIARWPKDSRHS